MNVIGQFIFSDVLNFIGFIGACVFYFFTFIKWPVDIMKQDVGKKEKKDFTQILLSVFKSLIYTIIFLLIYYFLVKFLWWHNISVKCGTLCQKTYVSNIKALGIFILLIGSFIGYYKMLVKEIYNILENSHILAYIFVGIFQVLAVIYLAPNVLYMYGVFDYLILKVFYLELLRYVIIFLPPLILVLSIYGKHFWKRIRTKRKR